MASCTSDRTLQTVTPLASALGLPIYVEHGAYRPGSLYLSLRDINPSNTGIGEWYLKAAPGTGLHPRPGTATSLKQYFPLIDPRWRTTWHPSRKGESIMGVHDRTADFLRAFFSRLDHAPPPPSTEGQEAEGSDAGFGVHKRILFMGHAASAITLVRELVGNRDLSIRVGCCTLTTLIPRSVASLSTPQEMTETPGVALGFRSSFLIRRL